MFNSTAVVLLGAEVLICSHLDLVSLLVELPLSLIFVDSLATAEPRRSLRVFQSTTCGSRFCALGLSKRQIVRAAAGKLQAGESTVVCCTHWVGPSPPS